MSWRLVSGWVCLVCMRSVAHSTAVCEQWRKLISTSGNVALPRCTYEGVGRKEVLAFDLDFKFAVGPCGLNSGPHGLYTRTASKAESSQLVTCPHPHLIQRQPCKKPSHSPIGLPLSYIALPARCVPAGKHTRRVPTGRERIAARLHARSGLVPFLWLSCAL